MLRRLNLLLLCLTCFVGVRASAIAAEIEILRVWPGWRDAESFERISEYFGGGENQGRQVILRTQPKIRAGYYFLVRVKADRAIDPAKFELKVVRPDTPGPQSYTFATTLPKKETVFLLGLTGPDWPTGPLANPVAWRVAVLGADNRVHAEQKSFLWEKP